MVRDGRDLTIVASGGILAVALEAADELSRSQGLTARVLSMHTVKPLDVGAIAAAARDTGGVLTLEEHTVEGGLGGAVAEALLERRAIPRAFVRVGLRGGFACAVGNQEYMRARYGLDTRGVVRAALGMLGK